MQFYKLAPGAQFEYQGKRYQRTAMDSIRDENGQPSSFRPEWEVTPIGEPLLLSEAEAEFWKPIDWREWAAQIKPALGQS